jgi:hypothetical protein
MKFDMGRAWNDAVAMLSANRHVVLVVAGAFFFLPYLALMLLMPGDLTELQAANAAGADPDAAWAAISAFYGRIWWAIVLMAVVQGIGMLGLLSLLADRGRPTVGQALALGAKAFLPYLAAQVLQGLALACAVLLIAGIGAATGVAAVAVILTIVGIAVAAYLFVKFSVTIPVIAIDRVMNPIRALGRSWRLTKGNSVRLLVFYLLLFVVLVVVAVVMGFGFGLAGVLFGAQGAQIVSAIIGSLINMAFVTVFLAVLAAVHRQLAERSNAPDVTLG